MLPTDDKSRKALPIFDGVLMYFPDALAAVAEVSRIGNEQHNPGEPLHWARGKSMDQRNTALRHMMDHARGSVFDSDGGRHLAKAAWRVLAQLQLDIERELAELKTELQAEGAIESAKANTVWPPGPDPHWTEPKSLHPPDCLCSYHINQRADSASRFGNPLPDAVRQAEAAIEPVAREPYAVFATRVSTHPHGCTCFYHTNERLNGRFRSMDDLVDLPSAKR